MTEAGAQAEAMRLLWEGSGRTGARRGPRPALSLTEIARAAVAIADADGLAAVTMQRVAEALGFTKMALYRYVPGKDELVALMIDLALGAPPPLPRGGWRSTLHGWTSEVCERFAQHPWTLAVTAGARPIGPNELDWLERAVAALHGCGLTGAEVLDVVVTLTGHARAIAQQGDPSADGGPESALVAGFAALVAGREDRFPALHAALANAEPGGQNAALDFGVQRILDGVEALITQRAAQKSKPPTSPPPKSPASKPLS